MLILLQLISLYEKHNLLGWLELAIEGINDENDFNYLCTYIDDEHGVELTDNQIELLKRCVLVKKSWRSAFHVNRLRKGA